MLSGDAARAALKASISIAGHWPATKSDRNQAESEYSARADLCALVRDELFHQLSKAAPLPEPAVRATRDLDFAAAP